MPGIFIILIGKRTRLNPMTKAHQPIVIKNPSDHTKTPTKASITQRLRTDLGQPV